MYFEDQYILDKYKMNFLNRDSKVVIYGIGERTENLLKNCHTDQIVGLMDAQHTGEYLYGKKILSYEEVSDIESAIIVIIARNSVINVIYRRIREFVSKNNIPVYDINGNLLTNNMVECTINECFMNRREQLIDLVDAAEVVSFDIFDTLLTRRLVRPIDVFKMVNGIKISEKYDFAKERVKAEKELNNEQFVPTIYDIYRRICDNVGDKQVEKLISEEINIEKHVLMKREELCSVLKYAKEKGKRIILISDMYLDKEILKNILESFGVLDYDKIYVSCDYGKTKATGLYDIVKESERINDKWLHIGDNYYSDVIAAQNSGAVCYRIYSPVEMLEYSLYKDILKLNNSIESSLILGDFAACAYNNPFDGFDEKGKINIIDIGFLARLFFSPIIFKYMVWLKKKAKKDEIKFIIFPSRDGFVLEEIYRMMIEQDTNNDYPSYAYLYTSRRAAMIAAAKTKDEIIRIAEFPGNGNIDDRAKKRFEIECSEPYTSEIFVKLALERCALERKFYVEYLRSFSINEYDRIALVDFVSVGSVHEGLEKILEKKIDGYYFLRRMPDSEYKKNMKVSSLYGTYGDYQMNMNLYKYYYFIELILSSYEPSFKCIDKNGEKCFYSENRTERAIDSLQKMHKEILDYCHDLMPFISNLNWDDSVDLYDYILGFFSSEYIDIENGVIDDFINVDEFMGRTVSDANR